jgi:hypothetical protein
VQDRGVLGVSLADVDDAKGVAVEADRVRLEELRQCRVGGDLVAEDPRQ